MENEVGHKHHHTTDNNIYWYFNVSVSFSFHLYNAITEDSCVLNFPGLDPPILSAHLQLGGCTDLH